MEHKKSKVQVYETTDYSRFRFRNGNRDTNEKKQSRIIKEIQSGNDILSECPIVVFENGRHLDINDGQNRFEIAKKLKRPVHYIIKKNNLSLYNLAKINSNTERWSGKDYIKCYVAAGNENYIQLQKFQKKYGFAIGVCLRLLTSGHQRAKTSGDLTPKFESGKFQVLKLKEATLFAEICKNFEEFPAWRSQGFVMAIGRILLAGLADMDVLVKKFKRDPRKLEIQSTWKDYANNLQVIYNYDNSKQRAIY